MSAIGKSRSDKVFDFINSLFLSLILIIVLYPLIYMLSCSFSSPNAVIGGRVWLFPKEPTLLAYEKIFEYDAVWTGYRNTIFYTLFGTIINVTMTFLAAYPLSRKDFYGRGFFMFIITFTMMFGGGLIPTYLLIQKLGLINTRWVMIIPGAVSTWNIIITRTFYQTTISDELLEAAQLDGCSDAKFFLNIVLPLSGAITAVNALFYAVGHWNSYFGALLYLHNEELYPLQIILRRVLVLNTVDNKVVMNVREMSARVGLRELLKYSLIVVSSVPVLIMYPFVQKYFVKGVMIGSLKG